jgi:hypothetical protein
LGIQILHAMMGSGSLYLLYHVSVSGSFEPLVVQYMI